MALGSSRTCNIRLNAARAEFCRASESASLVWLQCRGPNGTVARHKAWAIAVAFRYNGTEFQKNKYDEKLAMFPAFYRSSNRRNCAAMRGCTTQGYL